MEPTVQILARMAGLAITHDLAFIDAHADAASTWSARSADAILLSAMGFPDVRHGDGTEISP